MPKRLNSWIEIVKEFLSIHVMLDLIDNSLTEALLICYFVRYIMESANQVGIKHKLSKNKTIIFGPSHRISY